MISAEPQITQRLGAQRGCEVVTARVVHTDVLLPEPACVGGAEQRRVGELNHDGAVNVSSTAG
jgi:hypothetical protein